MAWPHKTAHARYAKWCWASVLAARLRNVVLDARSRRVVGWSMASHLRTELVLDALNMAIWQRRPRGVVHHSDQGPTPSFSAASRSAGWSPPEPASLRPATVFVTGARYPERPPQVDEPTARVESDSVR